ncbi:MAG: hypothetical protein LQ349_000099 [Xanthoria aureola]|nr:MAG: hypothetical protein LQ349_000099 [Xanthoria aureola]
MDQPVYWSFIEYANDRQGFEPIDPRVDGSAKGQCSKASRGDLKFIERVTGLEFIVELKDGMCKFPLQGGNGAKVLGHSQTQGSNDKTIFNWTRQWDFLFTTVDSAVAFLIPRDRIPKDWWNSQHRVVETSDDFGEYRIDTRSPRRTVHDIERVLDLAKETTNSMAAREKIPFGSCPWKTMEQPDDEELPGDDGTADDGADLLLPERWSTIAYTKGFGSYQQSHDMRGNTYAFWQSELLWEKCRIGGQAVILEFGTWNPRGRYAYVPLDFIQLHWTGDWAPGGTRQSQSMIPKIHGRGKSLVLCQTAPVHAQRLPHGLFVIPSQCLFDTRSRALRGIVKESEGIIDQYYAESDDLIDVLTAPLRAGGEATVEFMGRTIRVADYVRDVRSTLQKGVDCVKQRHQRKARKMAPNDP